MSPQRYPVRSVRELAAVVERIAPHDQAAWGGRESVPGALGLPVRVSQARARQLWMLLGMYEQAFTRELDPRPDLPRTKAAALFRPKAVEEFWRFAAAGQLRHWEKDIGRPLGRPTLLIVRDCLALLGSVVVPDQMLWLPEVDAVVRKDTVPPDRLAGLYRELVGVAEGGPLERDGTWLSYEDRTRLLAMVSIVLDAGPRSGELEAMRLDDLGEGLATVRVVRRPQNMSPQQVDAVAAAAYVDRVTAWRALTPERAGEVSEVTRQRVLAAAREIPEGPVEEVYPLRDGTRVAVRRWLAVREELVAGVEGGKSALWVTLQASKAGPKGVSLRAQGIRLAYARGIGALNYVMAGRYGWEPLPLTLEQLRRAVHAVPVEAPTS